MKKEIDWYGVVYFITTCIMLGTWINGMDNIISCFETMSYQVWICNQCINYWIFHISFLIWTVWSIIIVIDLICTKYEVQE